jgi:hypothetical protein
MMPRCHTGFDPECPDPDGLGRSHVARQFRFNVNAAACVRHRG